MKESLKVAALVACVAISLPLHAARRRAVAPAAGVLSIEFVDVEPVGASLVAAGSDAWIDLQMVGQQTGSTGKTVRVRRTFGLRIVRTGGVSSGTATVTARLDARDGRSSVRIDGQLLTGAPIVVSPRAAVGAMNTHTLEVEVPDSAAPGPLAVSISWEVTTL